MPNKTRNIHLRRLHGRLGQLAYEFTQMHFSHFCPPEGWQPGINAYRTKNCIQVCVDLAGVAKDEIDLTLESGRLILRGNRRPPEPERLDDHPPQILAMEIDCGPFERRLSLPTEVDPDRVSAEQKNGWLWIYLPMRPDA